MTQSRPYGRRPARRRTAQQIKRSRRLSRSLFTASMLLYGLGLFSYLVPPDARAHWMPGYASPGSANATTISLPLALFSLIAATGCLVLAMIASPARKDPVRERQRELRDQLLRMKDAGEL